jgi:hypothetical protein
MEIRYLRGQGPLHDNYTGPRVSLPPAFQPFKRARKFILLFGKANKILTNKLLCVTITAKNQQHKFARAFEWLKSWWKTYARPCIYSDSLRVTESEKGYINRNCAIGAKTPFGYCGIMKMHEFARAFERPRN